MNRLFALLLTGAVTASLASAEQTAEERAADTDETTLTSFEPDELQKLHVNWLSWDDEAAVCKTMRSSIGRFPTVRLARALCKVIIVIRTNGSKDTPKDIAYQMMNIVEARGQERDDEAIYSTFDTVAKIFNGSDGHVTPRDLNIFLRSAGPMAKTLSDDGLMHMAALIQEDKKGRGE